jgi:hypothetical protein
MGADTLQPVDGSAQLLYRQRGRWLVQRSTDTYTRTAIISHKAFNHSGLYVWVCNSVSRHKEG